MERQVAPPTGRRRTLHARSGCQALHSIAGTNQHLKSFATGGSAPTRAFTSKVREKNHKRTTTHSMSSVLHASLRRSSRRHYQFENRRVTVGSDNLPKRQGC